MHCCLQPCLFHADTMVSRRLSRRVCAVLVAVIATCWTVPWQPKCFVLPRDFVSKRGRVCRHADHADTQTRDKVLPKLPLGVESFERLRMRKPECAYVDKTARLVDLVEDGDQHLLTRPRRFGKTLLLDTIRCIFMENGRKKERATQKTFSLKIRCNFPSAQLSLTSFWRGLFSSA